MAEIIPPANPLVPLAAPPERARDHGRRERSSARFQRHRSFHEELSQPHAAYSYIRDNHGTHVRAARLNDDGLLSALVIDVEHRWDGPRTTVAIVREEAPQHNAVPASLLQPGRLVNIVV